MEGGRYGWVGHVGVVRGKWRQLYLNSNNKKKKKKNMDLDFFFIAVTPEPKMLKKYLSSEQRDCFCSLLLKFLIH